MEHTRLESGLATQQYIIPVVSMASAANSSSDKEQVIPTIDADQAHALLSSGHGYIDVRMRGDFDKGHAPGARNVPYYLSDTPQGKEKNPCFEDEVAALFGKDDVFIVGCNTGNRSRFATADLLNAVQECKEPARWLPLLSPECKSAASSTAVTITSLIQLVWGCQFVRDLSVHYLQVRDHSALLNSSVESWRYSCVGRVLTTHL